MTTVFPSLQYSAYVLICYVNFVGFGTMLLIVSQMHVM